MNSLSPLTRQALLFYVVALLLLLGCGGESNNAPVTNPEPFDIELGVELANLSLRAYQQLEDYQRNQTFSLPPPFILQEQFFTADRFAGETQDGGEGLPIGYAATAGNAIYLVFRGTQTTAEWINNARFDQTQYSFVSDGGNTHLGFTAIYATLHEGIVETVNNLLVAQSFSTLYITGHSLGGALAILAAPALAQRTSLEPIMYSFGSPRVGDPIFQQRYDELVARSWRTVNEYDLVPTLPPQQVVVLGDDNQVKELAYAHVSREREITFGNPIESPRDVANIVSNHAMGNYYSALCGATVDPVACIAAVGDVNAFKP